MNTCSYFILVFQRRVMHIFHTFLWGSISHSAYRACPHVCVPTLCPTFHMYCLSPIRMVLWWPPGLFTEQHLWETPQGQHTCPCKSLYVLYGVDTPINLCRKGPWAVLSLSLLRAQA